MPNLDGTGPEGKGPKTGRKQGRCANNADTSTINNRPRRKRNLLRDASEEFGLKRGKNA